MPCIARLLEKGTVNRSYCCPYQGSTNHLKGLRTSRVAPRFTQPCSRNWLTVLSFFVDKTMQPTRSYSCQHGSSKMDLGRLVGLIFWVSDQKRSLYLTVSSARRFVQYCNTIILHFHQKQLRERPVERGGYCVQLAATPLFKVQLEG